MENSETLSSEEYTSEEENPTLDPIPQQVTEEDPEQHTVHTDPGEEDPIADLSQHLDQSLHLKDQPQLSLFDNHQPLHHYQCPTNPQQQQPKPPNFTSEGQTTSMDHPAKPVPGWIP